MLSEEEVIVETLSGSLRGRKKTSARKGFYYSFQGIPYAEPPVGDLRFKAPLPVKPWSGVRDALVEGPSAPSFHMVTKKLGENQSEDCLYLNVYTPKVPKNKPDGFIAVMFYIHGGSFSAGSGNTDFHGPDYFVTENIVLVTSNYRVGALGFLSLQTTKYSGNNGLKDIILALKWCRDNISNFGGDPNNVTIFGESAGAAAVHYLMLSNASEGLFHKAIAQSGVAQNPWAFSKKPKEAAFKLGEVLGCNTNDDAELMEFLKTVNSEDMVKVGRGVMRLVEPKEYFFENAFTPCLEPVGADKAVLTMHLDDQYKSGNLRLVPFMLGANTLEGLIMVAGKPDLPLKKVNLNTDIKKLVPRNWNLDLESVKGQEVMKRIKDFYFPNGFNENKYVDVLSRVYFLNGINQVINYHQKYLENPTYVYRFSYDGEIFTMKHLLGYKHWKGTCHTDNLTYQFKQNIFGTILNPGTKDYAMMETMTKLWTDFAKNGKPLPESTWPPISTTDLPYLDINENLSLKFDLEKEEYKFWKDLYESVCQNDSDCRF